MSPEEISQAIIAKGNQLADSHRITEPGDRLPFLIGFLTGAITHAIQANPDQGESLARSLNLWTP